jgi:nucleoid DNA-binding protein
VESLTKGETAELRNFGIFKVKSRRPRVGRNPKTGATVPIPEKRIVTFKSGMVMKKKVMKEKTHV